MVTQAFCFPVKAILTSSSPLDQHLPGLCTGYSFLGVVVSRNRLSGGLARSLEKPMVAVGRADLERLSRKPTLSEKAAAGAYIPPRSVGGRQHSEAESSRALRCPSWGRDPCWSCYGLPRPSAFALFHAAGFCSGALHTGKPAREASRVVSPIQPSHAAFDAARGRPHLCRPATGFAQTVTSGPGSSPRPPPRSILFIFSTYRSWLVGPSWCSTSILPPGTPSRSL